MASPDVGLAAPAASRPEGHRRRIVIGARTALLMIIIAAIVTPTPDPFTQTIFAGPLYALYELAILVARRIEKKREAAAKL